MSNKVYDCLKWLCLICIPALGFFYSTISAIWGLPYGDEIPKTLIAIQTLLGACLGISTINYNLKQKENEEEKEGDEENGF